MRIIRVSHVLGISILSLSEQLFAAEDHIMPMPVMDLPNMEQHQPPSESIVDHSKDHGGQINQSTEFTNKWLVDDSGKGVWQGQLESWIGTDENKLFVQLNAEKKESEQTSYDHKLMYSQNVHNFWDIQTGVRYTYDASHEKEKSQTYAAFGVNGLAEYFLDTDIYAYIGINQQVLASIELDRDILLTQKLILKPYIDTAFVLSDRSKYARKSGLSEFDVGVETRYEITKSIMPYIDISYAYDKGDKQTDWQDSSTSEKSWFYGAGIQFNF